jgi:hypothetical protein
LSRSLASRWNAPPAETGDSWVQSPTSSTFAPHSLPVRRGRQARMLAIDASSTITSCPGRSDHRSISAIVLARWRSVRVRNDGLARCSWARNWSSFVRRWGWRPASVSHLVVLSPAPRRHGRARITGDKMGQKRNRAEASSL